MTRAVGSTTPRSTRIPASAPRIDLLTEKTRCWVRASIPPSYHSKATRPRCRTTMPSVCVAARVAATKVSWPDGVSNATRRSSRRSCNSGLEGPPAGMAAVGRIWRTLLNAHRLKGAVRQFASVTCPDGAGGKPRISPEAGLMTCLRSTRRLGRHLGCPHYSRCARRGRRWRHWHRRSRSASG